MKQTVALIRKAKEASRSLLGIAPDRVAQVLAKTASRIVENADFIIAENRKDLLRMDEGNPDYDRLRLSPERVADIASDMLAVSRLPEPYGRVLSETVRPNGMKIAKVSVPFGVIGVIYEARPNVTADVFGLCFRAGSACVLKGGHDADLSSRAIVSVIHECLREEGLPEDLCVLLPGERESAAVMMEAVGLIDVIIPRGGRGLIDYVRTHSVVPVIETGAGVCHTYIDASASLEKSVAVVCNAKTRRVSVCNALDCLLIHRDRLADLPSIAAPLKERNVVIYDACDAFDALRAAYTHLL
ncbi:MAG: glutamate-5-semialdehyde dehydrogenase, partial [Muribaculaceae bacterium]|nr:glutamate-5-semialdehyde dehydrogenase [Muribaculaceae bacterium]